MVTRGQPRRQPAAARQYQGALLRAGNGGGVAEGRPAGHPALRRLRRSDTPAKAAASWSTWLKPGPRRTRPRACSPATPSRPPCNERAGRHRAGRRHRRYRRARAEQALRR
ncbi:hypothetical protein G6F66_014360 [Rhizopus arrhizus]|nr:hypothetical protein G6F66_014360 [Rhizopus arrhizus]